ncbi:MAG: T9SS type A sorting domain-containing protein [Bacteroidales bacterium]|nr:T9SS type A sorting domain-containing protein [Bacteroidales bacterium]
MKKTILPILILFATACLSAQTIKKISTFDNTEYSSSGIIGITNNAIYEYSWYFDQWLSFPTSGLTHSGDQAIVRDVATCNNFSHNPSGIYVISDTSVHVYNYYAEYWYSLYNTGLERIDGIVQLSDLTVRYDTEYEEVDVYVVSGNHVYYYGWYTQQWYPIENTGITAIKKNEYQEIESSIYPNPVKLNSQINFTLPDHYSGDVSIAIFSEDSKLINEISLKGLKGGEHTYNLNSVDLSPGIFFYEIKGLNFSHVKKFIKFE